MKPKYSVGEKVLLRSIDHPEFNDVYHVSKVIPKGTSTTCDLTSKPYVASTKRLGYVLAEIEEIKEDGLEYVWHESSLRKFHDPSGDTFEEMMEKLNKANMEEFV